MTPRPDRRSARLALLAGIATLALAAASPAAAPAAIDFDTQWGEGGVSIGKFALPEGIAVTPAGTVYVADTDNGRVQAFGSTGTFLNAFSGIGMTAPFGVAVVPAGALAAGGGVAVADTGNDRLQLLNPAGTFIGSFGSSGSGPGQLDAPAGVGATSSRLFAADTLNHRIVRFGAAGFELNWGGFGTATREFAFPSDAAAGAAGVYVADTDNQRISQFLEDGTFLRRWGRAGNEEGEFAFPAGIALDSSGAVYVADILNNRIQKFSPQGTFLAMFGWGVRTGSDSFEVCRVQCQDGQPGGGDGQFDSPAGVAVDGSGNVYVLDTANNRVQKFTQAPAISNSPAQLDFGTQPVGVESAPRAMTIIDSGDWNLDISTAQLAGGDAGDFTIESDSCISSTVAAGASCVLNLTFTPSIAGARSTTLEVDSNAPGMPTLSIPVTGGAERRSLGVNPSSLSFGPRQLFTISAGQQLSVLNTGGLPVQIDSIQLIGKDSEEFLQQNDCLGAPIPVVQNCTVTVRSVPAENGPLSAQLQINSDDPDSPRLVPLSGIGDSIPPVITVKGPKRARKVARYGFSANEAVTGFICRIDLNEAQTCTSPFRVNARKLSPGRHVVRFGATDLAGNVGFTPMVLRVPRPRRPR